MPEAKVFSIEELRAGLTAEFERSITEEDIVAFAANSGDHNPLHIDAAYAATTNYQGRIVHGAFQVGLASAMVGMHLPGRDALLLSLNGTFPSPLYFPCRVVVNGEITSWKPETGSGRLRVLVRETTSRATTADIQMGFSLHQTRHNESARAGKPVHTAPKTRRSRVLVTGASGGLGTAIAAALSEDYYVYGLVNRNPLDASLRNSPNVFELQSDLSDARWCDTLTAALDGAPLYAIVHAAWPGLPHGGLLEAPDDVIESQLLFGSCQTIRLARYLFSNVESGGGRLVVLGSIVGSAKPNLNAAAYSLGKVGLEHTARLLAPELARKRITVNAISPGFIAIGTNKQTTDRRRLGETARVPLGRLCQPLDVVAMARYLLSGEASFVSGQVIGLTGGEL